MAITETVYSPSYPNNTKTVTIDMVSRIPLGSEGDEKYILYVYTTAYSDNTNRTAINPVYIHDIKRGWAQSFVVNTPVTVTGSQTLQVAIDEADGGAVTLTVDDGIYSGQTLAENLESQLQATASGAGEKASASNRLSYLNSAVNFEDGTFVILSGSVKSSYTAPYSQNITSSVKVTGGTLTDDVGFTASYANSYDLATTSSGYLHGPASAITNVDDAVRFAVMTIQNQIDFTS